MRALATRGVELAWEEQGKGAPVVLVHETATASAAWLPVAERVAEGARSIRYDRRGWGSSTAPDGYRRTTIEEQSEDAAALTEALAPSRPAIVCGAGIGAVIALDLLLRRPELIAGAVLVEPPLLALLPQATEVLSRDLASLESEADRGRDALVDLYLSGGLGALGAGVIRLPHGLTAPGRARPASVIAELGAVTGWSMPLPRLAEADRPSRVVVAPDTPPLLLAAAEALDERLPGSRAARVEGPGPPHIADPAGVAALALNLAGDGAG